MVEYLNELWFGNYFINIAPKAQSMQEMGKLRFIKMQNFCYMKNDVKRTKRQAKHWKTIFAKSTSDKEMVSETYKELSKFNLQKTNKKRNNLKMGQRGVFNRRLFKEDIQIENKHMKRLSTSYVIRQKEIKLTMKCYCVS